MLPSPSLVAEVDLDKCLEILRSGMDNGGYRLVDLKSLDAMIKDTVLEVMNTLNSNPYQLQCTIWRLKYAYNLKIFIVWPYADDKKRAKMLIVLFRALPLLLMDWLALRHWNFLFWAFDKKLKNNYFLLKLFFFCKLWLSSRSWLWTSWTR